MDSAYSILMK